MKKLVVFLLMSLMIAGPVSAGKNAGGALVVHTDDSMCYSFGICERFDDDVPQDCDHLITRTDRNPDTPALIWFIAAFHPDVTPDPSVSVVYFGHEHNLPYGHHDYWGFCGPDYSIEVPDTGWPEDPHNAGNSIAFGSSIVGDHFFPFYYFGVRGYEGRYYGTGINPVGGFAGFVDDSDPPELDIIDGFGRVYWYSDDGWNECPELPLFEHSQELMGVDQGDAAWGDFDGDGDLDLVISGRRDTGEAITQTYRNDEGTLVPSANNVDGVRSNGSGNLAWGDYDADGDLDLAVAGILNNEELSCRIYKNNGVGLLSWDTEQSLVGVREASVSWGDVDNDGDLDLLVMGGNGAERVTILYKNQPVGILTQNVNVSLEGMWAGSADWADWDGDGDLDLLTTGGAYGGRQTRFYKNDPVGTLTYDGDHGIPAFSASDAAWGDCDADGDLDLVVTGGSTPGGEMSCIYENDGTGNLTEVTGDLISIRRSSCAWGDYDNDGDLDVIFCGSTYPTIERYTKLFENTGGDFVEVSLNAPGVDAGSASWADVEGDGDLDLFLTGMDNQDTKHASLYEQVGQDKGRGYNTPPAPPANLTCEAPDTRLNLSWDAGTDGETPQPGLYYCLRVGTSPGANNIVSGVYAAPFMGNVGQATDYTLHVPPDTYYWSVRTIDSGFMASDWSEEQVCEVFGSDDYADHNVGNCVLTMTDQGILGFMDAAQTEGSGFVYPADGANHLYIGSLWVGKSTTYVANRDYSVDPAQEWTVSSDPDGHVWTTPNGYSDQDIVTRYTDAGAAEPSDLFVHQESWAFEDPDPANDVVIVRYTVRNDGDEALNDLYIGVFLDFDIAPALENTGGTDSDRNLVYMTDESGIHVGLQLLQDEGGYPQHANLTLIDNETYVHPNQYILDEDKYEFLSAADPDHILSDAPEPGDYGVLASVGPINMLIGEQHLICFAILGGEDLAELQGNADAARLIFRQGIADAPPPDLVLRGVRLLPSIPNPFEQTTQVRFELDRESDVHLGVYDVKGRLVRSLAEGPYSARRHTLTWDGRDDGGRVVTGGIYFLRLDTDESTESMRLIHLK